MGRPRTAARLERVQGYLAEATRIATLLTGDPEAGPRVAEESLAAALRLVPGRRRDSDLADAILAQLVRRALDTGPGTVPARDSEQLEALRALPRRQRAAVVLRYYGDLLDERASVFLGCSPRAAGELATRGTEGLPPEARSDVHDWLDATPLPLSRAPGGRWVLRRSRCRRVLRAAGTVAAVAVGIAAGLRVPDLLRPPAAPAAANTLADIHRILEEQEEDLPFDPDDPGPRTTRLFTIADGVVGSSVWNVRGYGDADGAPCLQLVVANEFGSRRCLGTASAPIRAVVDVDETHDATFISGMVAPRIEALTFVGPGVPWMDVALAREDPADRAPQNGYFGIALPERLLPIESPGAARRRGYEVARGRLIGLDAKGHSVAELILLLAQRP